MRRFKVQFTVAALAGLTMLGACAESGETEATSDAVEETASATLPNGMTVKEQIEARQGQLKKVGKAFKTIIDQSKSDSPDMTAIQAATASITAETEGMADWFPEGTGPDSGIETDALPIIWDEKEDFLQKVSDMQEAAAKLNEAAQSGDAEAIGAAFKTAGGTCKACHDKYRLDD